MPYGICSLLSLLPLLPLLLSVLPCSSAFLGAGQAHGSKTVRPRGTTTTAAASVSSDIAVGTKGYWDTSQPGVPDRFLRAIREEPWRGLFEPCVDHPLTEITVDGKVPAALEGTLFRNGPFLSYGQVQRGMDISARVRAGAGRNRDGDRAYGHWFDGDGHIAKIVFKDGRVYAQNRFVTTKLWDHDAPEGEGSARSVRAWTPRPGGWIKNVFNVPGNPLNTNVMLLADKLYALCEGGKPAEIDSETLETLGESDLGGIKAFYSAHPTTDPSTGETFNIGTGGEKNGVEITRLSADGTLDKSVPFTPPASLFWHDNTVTDDYVVAVTSPYTATTRGILKALLGFSQFGMAFKWDDTQESEALFFSRDTLELVARVELPGKPSSYHILNSFQKDGKGGNVTVVISKLREGGREKLESTFKDIMGSRFSSDILCDAYKYEIDVEAGKVLSQEPAAPMEGALPMELASVDPRFVGKPNRFIYTNAKLGDVGFTNCVQRCDLQATGGAAWTTHDFGESRYGGEPIFVPRSEDSKEGEGYLIVLVYNAKTHTTDVEVLDAQAVDAPPLCVAHIPWHMGTSFHGLFTRQAHLP